jgi:hypothetical protein
VVASPEALRTPRLQAVAVEGPTAAAFQAVAEAEGLMGEGVEVRLPEEAAAALPAEEDRTSRRPVRLALRTSATMP